MEDPMKNHKCKIIARAKYMEGRDLSFGELLEPIPGHPEERWCLHIKTPYKEFTLGLNLDDIMALAVFLHIAHEGPINPTWLDFMEKVYRDNAD